MGVPNPTATTSPNPTGPDTPALVYAFEARVDVGPIIDVGEVAGGRRRVIPIVGVGEVAGGRRRVIPIVGVGEVAGGRRRVIPIVGGTFDGPRLRGRVLPGADWQVVHDGTLTKLVARYLLKTDTGSPMAIVNRGLRRTGGSCPDGFRRDGRPVAGVLPHGRDV